MKYTKLNNNYAGRAFVPAPELQLRIAHRKITDHMQTSTFDNIVELMDESYKNYVANNLSITGNMLVQIAFRYGYRQGFTRAVEIEETKCKNPASQQHHSRDVTKMMSTPSDMFGNPEQLKAQAAIAAMSALVGSRGNNGFLPSDAIDSIVEKSVRLAYALTSELTRK